MRRRGQSLPTRRGLTSLLQGLTSLLAGLTSLLAGLTSLLQGLTGHRHKGDGNNRCLPE